MKAIKFPKIFWRKKKLRAGTTRRASASGAGFDDLSEPNMRLSRALLIVLLLHVVAVAGIIAFNAIKSRQGGIAVINSSHTAKASTNHVECNSPGSARVSRVGCGVSPQHASPQQRITKEVRDREDAITSTRDACATRAWDPI